MKLNYNEQVAQNIIFGGADDNYINHDTYPIFIEEVKKGSLDFFFDYIENEIENDEWLPGKEIIMEGPKWEAVKSAGKKIKSAASPRIVKLHSDLEKVKKDIVDNGEKPEKRKALEFLKNEIAKYEGKTGEPGKEAPDEETKKEAPETKKPITPERDLDPDEVAAQNKKEIKKEKFRTQAIAHMLSIGVDRGQKTKSAMTSINLLIEAAKAKKVGIGIFKKVNNLLKEEYRKATQGETTKEQE